MKKMLTLAFCAMAFTTLAQQVNNFTLTNTLNGRSVSLDTYPSCAGMILIFTSNNCAYDDYYRGRIAKLAQTYQDRVPVLLINSSAEADDAPDAMAKKGKQLNLTMPYLADKDQAVMTSLDVRKSPEVILLKNSGGKFFVVYRGAIDDNAQVEADVHHSYLRDAIDIMLTNQKIETPEVRPVGCNIRKK